VRRRRFLHIAASGAGVAALPGLARGQGAGVPLTRVAFGSCAHQKQPQPIWDAVSAYKPELFIFAGDNVYGDTRRADLRQLKAAYAEAATIEGYTRIRRETPRVMAIWDDHDYGLNDAGAEYPFKEASKAEFLKFWAVPANDPRRTRPGLYHAETIGPPGARVQVILLDTRWFRSPLKPTEARAPGRERYVPDPDPAKTMLGPEQWRWLEEQLRQPAEIRLVVSSIQLVVDGHGYERWGNLPLERARFYDLVRRTRAGGIVVLSGDRHLGALYRETAGLPYPLHEITSSGINRTFPTSKEAGPNRLGAVYGHENFGTLDIDWRARRLTLALRDLSGAVQRRHAIAFAEMAPRG
jgi:alkaline phosphatase D